jgi:alpha-beta hydrolase superfamily lysophospholipase
MTASAPAPVPLRFDAADGWCFGWYHAPAAPWRDLAVVMCPPVGHEAICSYPTYVQLARHWVEAGFPVLRFDWPGTGDSCGDDHEPGRVAAWLASVEAAVARARELSGATQVALFGLRLGASLALAAAGRAGGIDSLLLWAPCPTGRAFARELRAAGTDVGDGDLLTMGHHFRADTLADLQGLDATRFTQRPAPRALVIGRDDLPGEGPLPRALRAAAVEVEFRVLPGYAAMVGEPREGVLAPGTLADLTAWLAASAAARQRTDTPLPPEPDLDPRFTGAVRESPLLAGPQGSLCGVLAEPALDACGPAGQTGVVLLNVGGNYRIGPHRVYVNTARALAAAGYRVLRLDLAGIGDSPPAPGKPWANLYDKESAQDVRAALDALAARGCREFVLMGICSGSYVAFQSALVDPRVNGLVLMNSRLLEWTPGRAGDSWQDSMQQYVKSTAWYRRALFQPDTWRRLVRGQVNVRPIAQRFVSLALARARRLLGLGPADGAESLHGKMKRLCRRGTDVLMLVSDADDGRDYVEFHFGPEGRRMRACPNFRMAYVPDADHTFSRPGNQACVLEQLLRYLSQRPQARRPAHAFCHGGACTSSDLVRSTPISHATR